MVDTGSPPPSREHGGDRQVRRESVLRREASDRHVRDQLDQQQLARATQLSMWSAEEVELADEKRRTNTARREVRRSLVCARGCARAVAPAYLSLAARHHVAADHHIVDLRRVAALHEAA